MAKQVIAERSEVTRIQLAYNDSLLKHPCLQDTCISAKRIQMSCDARRIAHLGFVPAAQLDSTLATPPERATGHMPIDKLRRHKRELKSCCNESDNLASQCCGPANAVQPITWLHVDGSHCPDDQSAQEQERDTVLPQMPTKIALDAKSSRSLRPFLAHSSLSLEAGSSRLGRLTTLLTPGIACCNSQGTYPGPFHPKKAVWRMH
jgi:hypothetical protein